MPASLRWPTLRAARSLRRLAKGEATVTELAKPFELTQRCVASELETYSMLSKAIATLR